jgi:hypothetical protein
VVAWEVERNDQQVRINWRFTTQDARIKLKHFYPVLEKASDCGTSNAESIKPIRKMRLPSSIFPLRPSHSACVRLSGALTTPGILRSRLGALGKPSRPWTSELSVALFLSSFKR